MTKLLVIVGATASSKSKLALCLAKEFNAEIISADAYQIYKELNAGVNKPTKNDLLEIKHHFVSERSIYDPWDIKLFQQLATIRIAEIIKRNKNIIICGGTNLYIDALIKNYNLEKTNLLIDLTFFENFQYEDIYKYCLLNDEKETLKISFNNKKRIKRLANILYSTGKKKSDLDQQQDNYIFDCFIINVYKDRDLLYKKINTRFEKMLENDWEKEVVDLYNEDHYIMNLQGFKAIGYELVLQAILNQSEINKDLIKQKVRNYAKRQMTWNNNKYHSKIDFNFDTDNVEILKTKIRKFYGK